MNHPAEQASLARLPTSALGTLASLRREPGVMVLADGDVTWVAWRAGNARVLRCLLPLPGVALFIEQDGHWFPPGSPLPCFDAPDSLDGAIPLPRALTPEPVVPEPAPADLPPPARLALARDHRPRPTSALRCRVADLARWADTAPSAEIESARGARSGATALLLGASLPPIEGAERFWGRDLLVPLGFAPRPGWPEAWLRLALEVADDELALIGPDATVERIPRAAFRPLTRAGIRLALASAPEGGAS
ncbi:hypothetical protein TA3x_003569 [Tundrisphaera sp. TA3]|uniref:hypothetical protein n=1 Tax=Tundrisphaera sp. TA3 TaxID=3435775 RepID=UPI003EBABECA